MAAHPPNLQSGRRVPTLAARAAEAIVHAALSAHRAGTLREFLQRRRHLVRWLEKRHLAVVYGTAGDALRGDAPCAAVRLLLSWAICQLRPDLEPEFGNIDRQAWLERTSWRPMLAVACHYGYVAVPDFPDRYRRRLEEPAADNLCGLWAVGPSTYYRYLEKGKRLLAEVLAGEERGTLQRISLRRFVQRDVYSQRGIESCDARALWHRQQAQGALTRADAASALWHLLQARDASFSAVLHRFRLELAAEPETDALVDAFALEMQSERHLFDLHLAKAALWRTRNMEEREQQAYEDAMRIARGCDDRLLLGKLYGTLGKFHEPRDRDRALACFEDSAEFLRQASVHTGKEEQHEVIEEYTAALQKLAWCYVLRNDPRSRSVLERADALRETPGLSPDVVGKLEQTWGEYWRRAGDLRRALEHKHRALNVFERLGDREQILSTYNNLSMIYSEAKLFDRAVEFGRRVVAMADRIYVDPYVLTSALLNLGAAYFWQGAYDDAIRHYHQGLNRSLEARLPVHANRARYNLAEAYYKRFQVGGDPNDERLGDQHAAETLKASPSECDAVLHEAARNLKAEILGPNEGFVYARLLPEEFAAHFEQASEIQRQRTLLAVPAAPEVHVNAHLSIARAYLAMAGKEKEAALGLMRKHGLESIFEPEIDALDSIPGHERSERRQLASDWKRIVGELLDDERRSLLLDRLAVGESISKSSYAQLCSVALATASKHLSLLTERGLLVQVGKGPTTRYLLPGGSAGSDASGPAHAP